jgi:hypothetical protein
MEFGPLFKGPVAQGPYHFGVSLDRFDQHNPDGSLLSREGYKIQTGKFSRSRACEMRRIEVTGRI